ncbi:MAG: thioredoxin family protein [Verrucomicrobiota bacterium JB022]|nr:thioredoxin family protein [Verrucomicrobiota bacterium JB022]
MMKRLRLWIASLFLFAGALTLSAAEGKEWQTDVAKAQEAAAAENQLVLYDFTGSDWCPPCMALSRNIFSTEAFAKAVEGKFVLVEVDYPRAKPQSNALKRQNQQLADKYEIQAFPTIIVTDAKGNEISRIMGYPQDGLEGFLQFLKDAQAKAKKSA